MSTYTTINDLVEKSQEELVGNEYLFLTTDNDSFKLSLEGLQQVIINLTAESNQDLKNKIINDISNVVHANAVHFTAKAQQELQSGTPVKLVQSVDSDVVVDIATTNDDVIVGIVTDTIQGGALGSILVTGIIKDYDTSGYEEGDVLSYQNGSITNDPSTTSPSQVIGNVLDKNYFGRVLVKSGGGGGGSSGGTSGWYDNSTSELIASSIQDAIDELANRGLVTTPKIVIASDEIVLPSKAIGNTIEGSARIYMTDDGEGGYLDNVFTEYTCTVSNDGLKVLFDAGDNLNGYECTVSYFSV